jgi:hypothetical protein
MGIASPSTSVGSMGAPKVVSRQSGIGLPLAKSGIPMVGRKSVGSGIPVPR